MTNITGEKAVNPHRTQLNDALIESWTAFNYFIRSREKLRRDREAKLLGRLKVDDQPKLRWLLDRKVTGLRAFSSTKSIIRSL